MDKQSIFNEAVLNGESIFTETHALGDGEWSIEVHSRESGVLFELIGLNGTGRGEEATDLWAKYNEMHSIAYAPIHKMLEEAEREEPLEEMPPRTTRRHRNRISRRGGRN